MSHKSTTPAAVASDAAFTEAFRLDSPCGPCVAVHLPAQGRPSSETLGRLHPQEADAVAKMTDHRARTFAGGRLALRAALGLVGLPIKEPILVSSTGAPGLPAGARGSVSHKTTLAIAVAQAAVGEGALGIDLEHAEPGQIDIGRRVLRPEELAAIRGGSDVERKSYARRAFSIKEAIYKAGHPLAQRFFGFQEASVCVPTEPRMSEFYRIDTRLVPEGWAPDFEVTAYFYAMPKWVVSLASAVRNTKTPLRNNGLDGR